MGKKSQAERDLAMRVGARIRQLRGIRNISQVRLADEIGICAGPLGWIEKGKHLPSGRVLHRLAKKLNVRIDDFFQEKKMWAEDAPGVSVLLPPVDGCEAEEGAVARAACLTLADAMLSLEELCGAAKQPGIPLCMAFTPDEPGAEQLAARVREGLDIGDAVMCDYLGAMEAAGLRVLFLDMPGGCEAFSGYDPLSRNAFIFVNRRLREQPERQMERILFGLGRIFWHMRCCGAAEAGDVPAAGTEQEPLGEADFARRFAVHVLMPARALRKTAWSFGVTPKTWSWELMLRVKRQYGVRAQCLAQRLKELGLSWSDKQKRSARSYRFKEELEAFFTENGAESEPGGNGFPLAENGRLESLILLAEARAGGDQAAMGRVRECVSSFRCPAVLTSSPAPHSA